MLLTPDGYIGQLLAYRSDQKNNTVGMLIPKTSLRFVAGIGRIPHFAGRRGASCILRFCLVTTRC